jgi:hypothetical protein
MLGAHGQWLVLCEKRTGGGLSDRSPVTPLFGGGQFGACFVVVVVPAMEKVRP